MSASARCCRKPKPSQSQWRELRGASPRAKMNFLASQEAIAALGAPRCAKLRRDLRLQLVHAERIVASSAWLDAWLGGEAYPPAGDQVRMVRSLVSGRFHPPQCAGLEDYLDGLSAMRAAVLSQTWLPSPSARAIQMMAIRHVTCVWDA